MRRARMQRERQTGGTTYGNLTNQLGEWQYCNSGDTDSETAAAAIRRLVVTVKETATLEVFIDMKSRHATYQAEISLKTGEFFASAWFAGRFPGAGPGLVR